MKTLDVTYNESENRGFKPIIPGEYPAHVTSLTEREVKTKAGLATVFNLTYTVSDEAKKMTQTVYEMDGYNIRIDDNGKKVIVTNGDGKPEKTDCGFISGRKFRDNGFFCFTEKEGSTKNGRYFNLLQSLNVNLEEIEVDGKTVRKLALIEEEDVIGQPVTVRLQQQEYVTHETRDLPEEEQEKRKAWKVFTVKAWDAEKHGKPITLSADEIADDVPF